MNILHDTAKADPVYNISSAESLGRSTPSVRRWVWPVVHVVSDAIPFLIRLSIGFAIVYAATIAYGLMAGYALPTTTIFFLLPRPDVAARLEVLLPRAVLFGAIIGASLGWLPKLGLVKSSRLRRNEITSTRLLRRWGLLLICMALIFALSDGGWSGRVTGHEQNYSSLAGLIPNSDALGHFESPLQQILTGSWSPFGSRRPFAAAMRQLTMAATDFSYVRTLLLQAMLIAVALFAAARSIVLWRGLWCGLAFCALIYILVHPFLATALTEPLGLIWALLSIMFLAEAMRLQATRYAYLALVALTLAEMARMGSLFTIPAFVLWIAITFASTLRGRLRHFAIGSALVALVLLTQGFCAFLYGDPTVVVGGNSAFTLCGAALGGDWTSCPHLFAQQYNQLTTERAQTAFLLTKARQIISDNPGILLHKMYANTYDFLTGTLNFMLFGYGNGGGPSLQKWALVALIPGLYCTMRRKQTLSEGIFWILVFASMIASVAIIFADDGWRVMFATWPLVALLLSFGFTSPATVIFPGRFRPTLSARAGVLLIAAVIMLVVITPGITRLWPGTELARIANLDSREKSLQAVNVEQATLLGRTLTGFIVIPDGAIRPKNVPALYATDFANLVRDTHMEDDYGKFLNDSMKRIPFAFVTGMRVNYYSGYEEFYVAPIGILTEPVAEAWRVTFDNRLQNKSVRAVTVVQRLP
jgi:hypothetical protein